MQKNSDDLSYLSSEIILNNQNIESVSNQGVVFISSFNICSSCHFLVDTTVGDLEETKSKVSTNEARLVDIDTRVDGVISDGDILYSMTVFSSLSNYLSF